jgi:uncharacterized membrane-anchored protein
LLVTKHARRSEKVNRAARVLKILLTLAVMFAQCSRAAAEAYGSPPVPPRAGGIAPLALAVIGLVLSTIGYVLKKKAT